MFDQIKGQLKAVKSLESAIRNNRVGQAYLFYGPEGVGKFLTALSLGMALNCLDKMDNRPCGKCESCHKFLEFNHPNLTYIFPTPTVPKTNSEEEGEFSNKTLKYYEDFIKWRKENPWEKEVFTSPASIRIDHVRMLQSRLENSQYEDNYRICIIEDADKMNLQSANAFLKTLEEPLDNTIIILLTCKIQAIYPTILSRCQTLYFKPLHHKVIEDILTTEYLADKQKAKIYSHIANGNLEQAIRLNKDERDDARQLMLHLIESSVKMDDIFALNLLASTKDSLKAEIMHDILDNLAIWFKDLSQIKSDQTEIVNQDQVDLLNRCSVNISERKIDFSSAMLMLDDYHRKIDGKVNIQYILTDLFFKLKMLFGTI